MTIVPAKQLPPLTSEKTFEEFCVNMWRRLLKDPNAFCYGRRGQRQRGVDILGRRDGGDQWVGVQCKVRRNAILGPEEITSDIEAAKAQNPQLNEFIITTTTRRDTILQDYAREQTTANLASGHFSVSVFFWDDIEQFLLQEANIDLLQQYYGEFLVEACPTRLAMARMFTLQIGVDRVATELELLIGKTLDAKPTEDTKFNLAYFKNQAFLVNLNTRKAAIFAMPCRHYSDLAPAIDGRTDQFIVKKWLNSFRGIDELIRSQLDSVSCCISGEEWAALNPPYQG